MALTFIVVTELANTMKFGGGGLIQLSFHRVPIQTVSGDVTVFHQGYCCSILGFTEH